MRETVDMQESLQRYRNKSGKPVQSRNLNVWKLKNVLSRSFVFTQRLPLAASLSWRLEAIKHCSWYFVRTTAQKCYGFSYLLYRENVSSAGGNGSWCARWVISDSASLDWGRWRKCFFKNIELSTFTEQMWTRIRQERFIRDTSMRLPWRLSQKIPVRTMLLGEEKRNGIWTEMSIAFEWSSQDSVAFSS